jgi:hypothetical protein
MNLICSSFRISILLGVNNILPFASVMVTCTILAGFFASPGSPVENASSCA